MTLQIGDKVYFNNSKNIILQVDNIYTKEIKVWVWVSRWWWGYLSPMKIKVQFVIFLNIMTNEKMPPMKLTNVSHWKKVQNPN